jgi:capsular polysaccharide export protein
MNRETRSFLFLQGPASPFFNALAHAIHNAGYKVHRINFCGGDKLYWRGLPAWDFPGPVAALPLFLEEKFARHRFTDIVLFGDNRPIHKSAMEIAGRNSARVHVFEEGYIRPNWITLEEGGVNAHSSIPRDPDWHHWQNNNLTDPGNGEPVGPSMKPRAAHDLIYHLANLLYTRRFPGFRTHRPYNAHIEYAGWIRRFLILPFHARNARHTVERLAREETPFFLFPLQLNSDTQIVTHSPFDGMRDAIKQVVGSFAGHADPNSLLVIKNHPLDTGLIDYRQQIRKLSTENGIAERVRYIDGGHLPTLLRHAQGTVTVNSTVGLSAIHHACPTMVLGEAIYNMDGMTFQGTPDDFWQDRKKPDNTLYKAFRKSVIHSTQVNGGFYSRRGIEMVVPGCLERLETFD